MTTQPDADADPAARADVPWRLPPHIWHESARRAWSEAAEQAFTEGYEEGFREGLAVRRRVRSSRDLEELRRWRDRAYVVSDPEELFADAPA